MRKLELLSPAANKEIAVQAILHGADAVYIGGPSHGARSKASNSLEDIKGIVEFAHRFRAKVYVTVNTLVYENELKEVEQLIRSLYIIGVDAIIVQDMSILRLDLPPIELHASTQCDTRSVEKALFLQEVGFSQIVLARELSLEEIKKICCSLKVPVECFIHGALCVSYSGRCQASETCLGRSANRGECSQMCRMPYTLQNRDGEIILKDKYLLSLADFNASTYVEDLIEAGVSSFKIEGRLKDVNYVKNVTGAYRKILDTIISRNPDRYCRSSFGTSDITFEPKLEKSFNRGFTDYFLLGRSSQKMANFLTPKAKGERITDFNQLHNGDGISFYNPKKEEYEGMNVNGVKNGRILGSRKINIPKNTEIRRTFDIEWEKKLSGNTAERKIKVDIELDKTGVTASDERGVRVRVWADINKIHAEKPMDFRRFFEKTGGTIYSLRDFTNKLDPDTFIPASVMTSLRRKVYEELDRCNGAVYPYNYRRQENKDIKYISSSLISLDNVANSFAKRFYQDHGVKKIEDALELRKNSRISQNKKKEVLMTSRYCLRRELGCCKKNPENLALDKRLQEPLYISTGPHRFLLKFDCGNCEMNVIKEGS